MSHRGMIDSINLNNLSFVKILDKDTFRIEPVKGVGVFEPHRWLETFGKSLTKNIVEASIVHTQEGSVLPLKRYSVKPKREVLEFAGINGYTEKSELLKNVLNSLLEQLKNCEVTRVDIAVDFNGKIPNSIIKTLCKNRGKPLKVKNTTYYKTEKEKKTNTWIDIKKYNKSLKDGLGYPLERLEFVFKSSYLKKIELKELESILFKMEKTIKKFAGITVKIESI